MISLRGSVAEVVRDHSGAGAVEFALVLPAVLMVIVGGIHLCLVSYTLAGLHYATEAAARCASLDSTNCGNSAAVDTYAKSRFIRVEHRDVAEMPDADYPYVLTTGRIGQQYQSGNQTRRVRALTVAMPEPFVEVHPDLARRHGIDDNDVVELRSRRGRASFRARLTTAIRPDTLFAPFHWGGTQAVNQLTNPALDRHSKMPAFKACAVAMQKGESCDDS
jgi:predicted molibdopterin-dependent oxidoreductase YjgC/Flp pilus assembly pilin Flp